MAQRSKFPHVWSFIIEGAAFRVFIGSVDWYAFCSCWLVILMNYSIRPNMPLDLRPVHTTISASLSYRLRVFLNVLKALMSVLTLARLKIIITTHAQTPSVHSRRLTVDTLTVSPINTHLYFRRQVEVLVQHINKWGPPITSE